MYLRLFVYTQHHGLVRRIEVQADNVADLLDKARTVGQLERALPMRLHAEQVEPPLDGAFRHARLRRHGPSAPVRAVRGQRLQGRVHDLGHPIVVVRSRATRTLLIVQSFDPVLRVAFAPLHHRVLVQLQLFGDGGARLPVRATEHDLGACCTN